MSQRWTTRLVVLSTIALILAGCGAGTTPGTTPQEPRTINAVVGAGEDTTAINAFLPTTLKIRAGDTVTWTIQSDEPHTVSFLGNQPLPGIALPLPNSTKNELMFNPQIAFPSNQPGAPIEVYKGDNYINSGLMSKVPAAPNLPPNDKFSVKFDTPGFYKYICIIHGLQMQADLIVEPATEVNVPSQADIDKQVEAERVLLEDRVNSARAQGQRARQEPAANDTSVWYVKAGGVDFISTDERAQAYDFLPKEVTIKAGDTVVWASPNVHSVAFVPTPPDPLYIVPQPPVGDAPPVILMNPVAINPAKPAEVYDPTKFFNSADIGPFSPGGLSWSLTFDKPGTYRYICILHKDLGMEGTVIVTE
jgi:plastocyanin